MNRRGQGLARLAALGLIALFSIQGTAWAQAWPTRPVRIIVPAGAGGPTDVAARVLAERLGATLGQPVVVDNRPGASHMIGTEAVARAEPDGHTFGVVTTPHVVNPVLRKKMPYDTQKDLAPVSWLTSLPLLLVVHPSVNAGSVKELIDLMRAQPGKLNLASPGAATGPHLAGELFKSIVPVSYTHVPYKSGPQATTAVITGEAHFMFDTPSSTLPQIRAGKLRALAVTTLTRFPAMPELAPLAELGLPGYEINVWNGLVAPAATPRAIIERMQQESARAMASPEAKARFTAVGFETVGSSPAEFAALIERDLKKWQVVFKDGGLSAD